MSIRWSQKGLSKTRQYRIWHNMLMRCYREQNKDYHMYGARGIKVCDEWKDNFLAFYEWSNQNGYQDDLTLDRIDFNGNYSPQNCRWITFKEQHRNCRTNKLISYNDKTQSVAAWAEEYNLPWNLLYNRITRGWPIDIALTTPVDADEKLIQKSHLLTCDNTTKTITEWSQIYGVPVSTIRGRLAYGWDVERAIKEPPDLGSQRKHPKYIMYNNESKTIQEWAMVTGFSVDLIRHRLFNYHWPVDKALTVPPNYGNKYCQK